MGAEPKRNKKKTASNPPAQPGTKPRKKADKSRPGDKTYEKLAWNYCLCGVQTEACYKSGFSPESASYLFRLPKVWELVEKYTPEAERFKLERAKRATAKAEIITDEFIDVHAAHIIANGPTHFMRGDADKVAMLKELIEERRERRFPPQPKIVNNVQANAQVKSGTMYEIYKAQWLIDKENELRQRCEAEYAAQHQLPAATEPSSK